MTATITPITPTPRTTLEWALHLASAKLGHTVFPADVANKTSYKSKRFSGGVNWGATSDLEQIRKDFLKWPNAGIGLPTGAQTDCFVVEADTLEGGHAYDG